MSGCARHEIIKFQGDNPDKICIAQNDAVRIYHYVRLVREGATE